MYNNEIHHEISHNYVKMICR